MAHEEITRRQNQKGAIPMSITNSSSKTVWRATCESCITSFAAWPHWENQADVPDPDLWDNSSSCPACGAKMSWDFGDPVTSYIPTGYAADEIT